MKTEVHALYRFILNPTWYLVADDLEEYINETLSYCYSSPRFRGRERETAIRIILDDLNWHVNGQKH